MIQDLLQVLAVIVAIIKRDGDTLGAKSTCTANPMQIVLGISFFLLTSASLGRDIEVDNHLNFRHIYTASEQISSDNHRNFACSELGNHLVALIGAHISKDDGRLVTLFSQHLMQAVRIVPSIDENDSLSHFTHIEDGFEEFWFLSGLTTELILADIVQLELLLTQVDLLSFSRELSNSGLDIIGVCGREEDVLNFLGQL